MSKLVREAEITTLEYDLYDLPTAQHKAGLAGLLIMIESLKKRKMMPLPEVKYDATSATISFTKENLQIVFDDLYDASWEEIELRTKRSGEAPKREITRQLEGSEGKKNLKYYVYDKCVPKGAFLKSILPTNSDVWLNLWRDMLWETLRGIPKTRGVYLDRANKKSTSLVKNLWDKLATTQPAKDGKVTTESIVSSTFIGAQDVNAENVPFQGTIQQNLLLHFWPIASLIFVPRVIKKVDKARGYQMQEVGYVITVPEPSNLQAFIDDALRLFGSLDVEKSGFRPKSALITLPEESALEYFSHLAVSSVSKKDVSYSLSGIDVYHLEKRGNKIDSLAVGRVSPNERELAGYRALSNQCHNPLYRSQRMRNLLGLKNWYIGMDSIINQYPSEFFIYSEETPGEIPFFGIDVARTMSSIEVDMNVLKLIKGGEPMSQEQRDNRLAICVNRLIREYVNRRTEEKSGGKYDDFKNNKDANGHIIYPNTYREAKEKICSDAFLAMRGRREQDFVEYFTGTICSVAQYLPEEDYIIVSRELMAHPDIVKTLSMLALSAVSYTGRTNEEGGKQ